MMTEFQDPPLDSLADWLLLEALGSSEDQTPSGLLIPATASKNTDVYQKFRIVSAGAECTEDRISELPDPAVGPGDIVFVVPENTGMLRYDGVEYRVCRFEAVVAVVRDEIDAF